MSTTMFEKLLTPAEVSEILHIKESTLSVWRSVHRYNMKFIKAGKKVLYPASEVQRFIDERTRQHT